MQRLPLSTLLCVLCLAVSIGAGTATQARTQEPSATQGPAQPPSTRPATRAADPRRLVLDIARSYPDGGVYRRDWSKGTGSPEEIRHGGELILAADDGGTYCCGYTLAVVMRAMNELGLLEEKSAAQMRRFQKLWYGATSEDRRRLVAYAVEDLGVGREVERAEARPGDFLQLWRTDGSGHSVVFLGWETDGSGQRVGVRYRSSQGSTHGIGDATERFAHHGGRVDPQSLHFARLNASQVK